MYKFTYTETQREKVERKLGAALFKFWQSHAPGDANILAEIFPHYMDRDVIEKHLKSMLFFLKLELADEIKNIKDNNRQTLEKLEEARNIYRKEQEKLKEEFKNNCIDIVKKVQAGNKAKPKLFSGTRDNIDCYIFLENRDFIKKGFFGGYVVTKKYSETTLEDEIESKFEDDGVFSKDFLEILKKII